MCGEDVGCVKLDCLSRHSFVGAEQPADDRWKMYQRHLLALSSMESLLLLVSLSAGQYWYSSTPNAAPGDW
jgi:hypothetical protein